MPGPVLTIDCRYLRPRYAASYLLVEGRQAVFVENNTAHSVPLLLEALAGQGIPPERVEYLVITHVHLDHAGGSSALMKACPRARLLAHPRAAPHMIDPSRLVSSAKAVYGEERFAALYGELGRIEPSRVRAMADGEELQFGGRKLAFLHTRGHANHHFCVLDSGSDGIFTGDSFGIAYPALQGRGLFVFPSTSPTDFDPAEARKSIDRILATGAKRAYLTHYGELTELKEAAAQLNEHLDESERILEEATSGAEPDSALDAFCGTRLRRHFERVLARRGIEADWELLELDLDLNAQGIAHAARKRRRTGP